MPAGAGGVDKGFVLSDHGDFRQLNEAIRLTGAERVYVTHGYERPFSRWITEGLGLHAEVMDTLYADTEPEEL